MVRIVVLDISGMYAKIYDEVFCSTIEDAIKVCIKYNDTNYVCIKIEQ